MDDPFAGYERLNQLTPEQMYGRSDRMSHQPLATWSKLSDADRNEQSRLYHLSLTNARTQLEQEQYEQLQKQQQLNNNENNTTTTTTTTTNTNTEPQIHPNLPYGWNERHNQTVAISNLSTDVDRLMKIGPDRPRDVIAIELQQLAAEIIQLRDDVDNAKKALLTTSQNPNSTPDEIQIAKTNYQTKRNLLTQAEMKEETLMNEM